MLNINQVATTQLQESYKAIIDDVKTRKRPVVLATNYQPQAAIISLSDLELLQQGMTNQVALAMLKLAADLRESKL